MVSLKGRRLNCWTAPVKVRIAVVLYQVALTTTIVVDAGRSGVSAGQKARHFFCKGLMMAVKVTAGYFSGQTGEIIAPPPPGWEWWTVRVPLFSGPGCVELASYECEFERL